MILSSDQIPSNSSYYNTIIKNMRDNNINVLYTHNSTDINIYRPLTPWIMAHRILHSIHAEWYYTRFSKRAHHVNELFKCGDLLKNLFSYLYYNAYKMKKNGEFKSLNFITRYENETTLFESILISKLFT